MRCEAIPMVTLAFNAGTLTLHGIERDALALPPCCRWDSRAACHRAPAVAYREVVLALKASEISWEDQARQYQELAAQPRFHRDPRPYQTAAMEAWQKAGRRGVVVLPTGAGKTHVAVLAVADCCRSTLVVVPTLDLMRQWYDLLRASFNLEVGLVGGGDYDVRPLTITTYDSAYLHMENIGARFGLVVFDECHHLPGPSYALGARFCLAPFRLGLTATPERADGREDALAELIGPIVFRKDIVELSGSYLADYETVRVRVDLSPAEREEYDAERAVYLTFVRQNRIRMGSAQGWSEFIIRASRSEAGQRALRAYRRQRELAIAAPAKLDCVETLLAEHQGDRTLIFTEDNATAYRVSRRFLVPAITHQTRVRERSEVLEKFSRGDYGVVVTSKVLNEGVDVPDARVAIVISGSGSVREHVQRLGRILRPQVGKRAVLYELVSADTAEAYTSQRRREHEAYRAG